MTSNSTPRDSRYYFRITTTDIEQGAAILLKYGHALKSGFYPWDLDPMGRPAAGGRWVVYGETNHHYCEATRQWYTPITELTAAIDNCPGVSEKHIYRAS
jgi:hypothetical protein